MDGFPNAPPDDPAPKAPEDAPPNPPVFPLAPNAPPPPNADGFAPNDDCPKAFPEVVPPPKALFPPNALVEVVGGGAELIIFAESKSGARGI